MSHGQDITELACLVDDGTLDTVISTWCETCADWIETRYSAEGIVEREPDGTLANFEELAEDAIETHAEDHAIAEDLTAGGLLT